MSAAPTLVWVAPAPPSDAQTRALASWAREHGVHLVQPVDEAPPSLPVDLRVADAVGRALDQAREAIAARDRASVEAALAAADSLLRAHPELPQSAWLMAEVERTRSTSWRRVPPLDEEAAERAWQRAEGLDGGRVPGIGELPARSHPPRATAVLEAIPPGDVAWVDGASLEGSVLQAAAGLHDVVVLSDGAVVGAAWVDIAAGSSAVRLSVPGPPPCSRLDVARVRWRGDSIDAEGARCPQWVTATPGEGGAIRFALCEGAACGPILDWRDTPAWPALPPNREPTRARWPTWATWSLVGAGAVVAAGVAVFATGALQSAPAETRFVSGGLKVQ